MTTQRPPATYDDALQSIGSLIDHIKVLVTAVDDLRVEIEWRARNEALDEVPTAPSAMSRPETQHGGVGEDILCPPEQEIEFDSLLTATGRLRALEKLLYQAPRGLWLDEWAEHDYWEMPTGRIIPVSRDIFESVLDIRPAHVVGDNGCCEAGGGTPFLLAWQTEREFLLRELTYDEARQVKDFCLACQAERADAVIQEAQLQSAQSQLGLF